MSFHKRNALKKKKKKKYMFGYLAIGKPDQLGAPEMWLLQPKRNKT